MTRDDYLEYYENIKILEKEEKRRTENADFSEDLLRSFSLGSYTVGPSDPAEIMEQKERTKLLLDLCPINERHQYVFEARISGLTWKEIGDDLGVSRERARQIYKKIVSKKKRRLRIEGDDLVFLEPYLEPGGFGRWDFKEYKRG